MFYKKKYRRVYKMGTKSSKYNLFAKWRLQNNSIMVSWLDGELVRW